MHAVDMNIKAIFQGKAFVTPLALVRLLLVRGVGGQEVQLQLVVVGADFGAVRTHHRVLGDLSMNNSNVLAITIYACVGSVRTDSKRE